MADITWPTAPCCAPDYPGGCVCPPAEMALRGWSDRRDGMPAMTADQREWCLNEIGQVEGYQRAEYESCDDADLARGVLDAWTDYCRDKGLM